MFTKTLNRIVLGISIGLFVLLILSSCSLNEKKTDLNKVIESYIEFKEKLENEVKTLSESEEIISRFENNQFPTDQYENLGPVSYFDIQGTMINGYESIRDTIAYTRLMGHLDYFSEIIPGSDRANLMVIAKVYSHEPKFIGIICFHVNLNGYLQELDDQDRKSYLLDTGRFYLDLSNDTAYEIPEENENFRKLKLEAQTFENDSGRIFLSDNFLNGEYYYLIENGIAAFSNE